MRKITFSRVTLILLSIISTLLIITPTALGQGCRALLHEPKVPQKLLDMQSK